MTAAALLEGLKSRGATVAANGDRLKLAAPPGVLKPRVLELVAQHKAGLLELLQSDPLTPGNVPPADGLQRRGAFIASMRQTMPAYRAHFEAKAASGSTPDMESGDRQTERIRKLSALVSADELLAARAKIKPTLQKSLSEIDLHELALTLAYADKQPNRSGAAREVNAGALFQSQPPTTSAKELN
jgi:hypothetical protein